MSFGTVPRFLGIASSKQMPIFYERPFSLASPKFSVLFKRITAVFDSLETIKVNALISQVGQINGAVNGWSIPVSAAERKKIPITIEVSSIQSLRPLINAYRFRARKEYRNIVSTRLKYMRCPNFSSFSGWLLPRAGGKDMVLSTGFTLDFCYGKEGSNLYPLGYFTHNGYILWIGRRVDGEKEYYDIYRIKAGMIERILQIYGGGC
jgi:hypothetical protein